MRNRSHGGWSGGPKRPGARNEASGSNLDALDAGSAPGEAERGTAQRSNAATGGGAAERLFGRVDASRYQPLEVVGRGGMGEVLVVHDRQLGRDVALKRLCDPRGAVDGHGGEVAPRTTFTSDSGSRVPGVPASDALARFRREAWVTARLEHPAIVPLYDAGTTTDGAPFYTMRLIHGQSLALALRDAHSSVDRQALLRNVLAVVQAMAYAHSHGILHRDLKPENIMVGPFGETLIIDWGLAGFVGDAIEAAVAAGVADQAAATGAVGTPGYMSPEQAAGGGLDERSDVWALGAILAEVITGTRFVRGRSTTDMPKALRAIVVKCTADTPRLRYRDASELYDDLARFMDGRRVAAHEYSTWELAQRLVRRLRVPLLVFAAIAVTSGVALAVSVQRIAAARGRAEAAEREAVAAAAQREATASAALARHAVAELASGALADAAVLASHALVHADAPDARGVIAAAAASTLPLATSVTALAGCDRVVAGTWHTALCVTPQHVSLWDISDSAGFASSVVPALMRLWLGASDGSLGGARLRWQRQVHALRFALLPTGDVAVVDHPRRVRIFAARDGAERVTANVRVTTGSLDLVVATRGGAYVGLTEGRVLTVLNVADGRVHYAERPCRRGAIGALTPYRAGLLVVCDDGALVAMAPPFAQVQAVATVASVARVQPTAAAVSDDDHWLAVGGVQGEFLRIELATAVAMPARKIQNGTISQVGFWPNRADWVVLASEGASTRVWDVEADAEWLRVPLSLGANMRITEEGLVTGGKRLVRWRLPMRARPRAIALPVGIASVAVDPQGRWLAIGRADGKVELREAATGRLSKTFTLGGEVIKYLDFSNDGTSLAVSISGPQTPPLLVEVATGHVRPLSLPYSRAARRLAFDASGNLVVAHYDPPVSVWDAQLQRSEHALVELIDVVRRPARDAMWFMGIDGGVQRWAAGRFTEVTRVESATMVAWSPQTPNQPIVARPYEIGVPQANGTLRWLPNRQGRITDVAASPDGEYVLAGRSDGTIAVWRLRDLAPVAVLRGHTHRVAQLTFLLDGTCVSVGWDGQILHWSLAALAQPAVPLVSELRRVWGATLDVALAAATF